MKLKVGNLEGNKVKNEKKGPKIVWLRRGEGLDLILRREDSQREGDSIWFLEGGELTKERGDPVSALRRGDSI